MREELDKKLVETYPELYANRPGMWSKDEG